MIKIRILRLGEYPRLPRQAPNTILNVLTIGRQREILPWRRSHIKTEQRDLGRYCSAGPEDGGRSYVPRNARNEALEGEKDKETAPPLESPEGAERCQHLGFCLMRLLSSRT